MGAVLRPRGSRLCAGFWGRGPRRTVRLGAVGRSIGGVDAVRGAWFSSIGVIGVVVLVRAWRVRWALIGTMWVMAMGIQSRRVGAVRVRALGVGAKGAARRSRAAGVQSERVLARMVEATLIQSFPVGLMRVSAKRVVPMQRDVGAARRRGSRGGAKASLEAAGKRRRRVVVVGGVVRMRLGRGVRVGHVTVVPVRRGAADVARARGRGRGARAAADPGGARGCRRAAAAPIRAALPRGVRRARRRKRRLTAGHGEA